MRRIRRMSSRPLAAALAALIVAITACEAPAAVAPKRGAPAEAARPATARPAANPTAPKPMAGEPAATPDRAPARAASAIVAGDVHRTSLAIEATYDVRVRLSTATRRVSGKAVIGATNRSGAGIDRVLLNTVMAKLGNLDLGTVTVDGTRAKARVRGQTIVVPLGGVLPDGAATTIVVPFDARLRSTISGSSWLFTRANGIVDMHRWIPWISRKRAFERPNHGDPFVTPVSPRVSVRIRTDVPLDFATTGSPVASADGGRTRTFRAANVRDFVITAAADYRSRSATVGGTTIRVRTRPGFPAAATLDAATSAFRKLERKLGPYPYRVLRVVQSSGAYGMEGPGIVWIPTGTPSGSLRYLVAHEIAHQWFYGLVGNDQAREPFADEAAADFVARRVTGLRRGSRCAADDLDRSIYRYSSTCYYEVVYIQGGNLLDNVRLRMGSKPFWAAIRGYLDDHRFGLTHTRTLLDALDDATPLDLRATWRRRFPSLY